ncbi:alpha/beta hydrolase [Nocardia sp. NPDC051052]|uniref:alpha/beta hydrolase n=1 Tax=Nocardia sp. NPDC051052 TaxID=3364322 RepID=UPI0037956EC8
MTGGIGCDSTSTDRGLAAFYDQHITWGSCSGFSGADTVGPEIECARVLVPIDYDKPDGNTAQIATSRARARGSRIGSAVFNPGGPGGLGLGKAAALGRTALGDRFDAVGFDPRGSGASTPEVECLTPSEAEVMRPDDFETDWSPAGVDAAERQNRDYVAKCVQRSGTELLGHVGTREAARDLDVIRAALGDDKLTYVGYSYGTRLGAAYAEAFPQHLRAMVLDSGEPLDGPVVDMVKYYASLQQGFDTYARDCTQHTDCPLGTDPSKASHVFRTLLNPLIGQPVPVGERTLTYSDALTAVVAELYAPTGWPTITTGLRQLKSDRGDILLETANGMQAKLDTTLQNAVLCLDGPRTTDRAAVAAVQQRMFAAAPFLDDGHFAGHAPLDKCAFWPTPSTSTPHTFTPSGLPPIVVVAATGDPAAAYEGNQTLARQLGSPLVTSEGKQHGVFLISGSSCVDTSVLKYLTELATPPDGLNCRQS